VCVTRVQSEEIFTVGYGSTARRAVISRGASKVCAEQEESDRNSERRNGRHAVEA
jgi:hypothetical protein